MTLHPKATFGTTLPDHSAFQTSDLDLAFANDLLALRPALQAFARRLTNQACDADDLVQETLMRALRAQHLFGEGTNLKSWLFTIMRNTFITRWRRSSREVTTEADAINFMAITPATQETLLWAQQVAGLLLHHLSPTHRDVLILISVQGLSYEDVAQMSGCAVGTVKSRVSRARASLAALVDDPSGETEPEGGILHD